MDLFALGCIMLGFAIVLGVMWTRRDTQPRRECVKCGEDAVFGKELCCRACGAYQEPVDLDDPRKDTI